MSPDATGREPRSTCQANSTARAVRSIEARRPPADTVNPCLFCGAPMYGVHCKLVCPNCGYREDCSDIFPDK